MFMDSFGSMDTFHPVFRKDMVKYLQFLCKKSSSRCFASLLSIAKKKKKVVREECSLLLVETKHFIPNQI